MSQSDGMIASLSLSCTAGGCYHVLLLFASAVMPKIYVPPLAYATVRNVNMMSTKTLFTKVANALIR